jgi:hypothetical protein
MTRTLPIALSPGCNKPQIEQIGEIDMLVNPQLIVEVLSDSTEAFDRGDKISYYKSIESFSEYLLVAQHRPRVSQFVKHADGFWLNFEFNDLGEPVELKSVPCTVQCPRFIVMWSFRSKIRKRHGTRDERRLKYLDRERQKAQHKDHQRKESHGLPFCVQRRLIPRDGVADLHHNAEEDGNEEATRAVEDEPAEDR